jgi:hypothetical protein
MRTKKELARLARVARSFGTFGQHDGERGTWSVPCPVQVEMLRAARVRLEDGISAHRFPVHHLPWEHTLTAPMMLKALTAHLSDAEENGEPCDDISTAVRR